MDPTFSIASVLPITDSAAFAWTWVAEALAVSDVSDSSLIHGIVSSVPELLSKASPAARYRIALKYLEEWLDPRRTGLPLLCDAGGIGSDRSVEDDLLRLLGKAETSGGLQKKETEVFMHDLHQFVLKKQAALPKCFVEQLLDKDYSCFSQAASLKERAEVVDLISSAHFYDAEKAILQECSGSTQPASSNDRSGFTGGAVPDFNGFEFHSHPSGDQTVENHDKKNDKKRRSDFADDKLRRLKKISSAHSSDADKAILQEYPSRYGQRSPQQNDVKIQLQKKISDVLLTDRQKSLQEDFHGYGQHSAQQTHERNDEKFKSAKQVSSALTSGNGRKIPQQENSRSRHQTSHLNVSEHDNRSFPQRDTSITCDETILQKVPCESGRKSPLQRAQRNSRDNSKELPSLREIVAGGSYKQMLRGDASGSWEHPLEANSAPLMPCNETKKNQGSRAFGSEMIIHPSSSHGDIAQDELSISKATGEVDVCHQKIFNVKNQNSYIPVLQDSAEGDIIENGLCFKCDKGGLLLNCSTAKCSVAVHESCMGPSITYGREGGLLCPLCSYTQAALSYSWAKTRFAQAKKALKKFLGKDSEQQSQE